MYVNLKKTLNDKDFFIRIVKLEYQSTNENNNLKNKLWFNWYFDIPNCADARLIQFKGTCWVNVVLNSLFLSENISKIIIKMYNSLDKKKKKAYSINLNEINEGKNLNKILFSLIYNLLIEKKKPIRDDGDFIFCIGKKIKKMYNKYYKAKTKGISGDASFAIRVIFKIIFKSIRNNYKIYDPYTSLHLKYNELVKEYNNKIKNEKMLVDEYNDEIKKKYYDENKIKNMEKILDDYNDYFETKKKDMTKLGNDLDNFDYSKLNIENFFKFKDNNVKIVAINGKFIEFPKEIKTKKNIYEIDSVIIRIKSDTINHVISGFKCDGNSYIYDSNNSFVKCNWEDGKDNLNKYFLDANTIDIYKGKISFLCFTTLIYTLK